MFKTTIWISLQIWMSMYIWVNLNQWLMDDDHLEEIIKKNLVLIPTFI